MGQLSVSESSTGNQIKQLQRNITMQRKVLALMIPALLMAGAAHAQKL